MTNKAAIYVRVSTHWQVDKDSLQVQKRELIAYCEMILNITDYEIFEDPGYSAKNTDRPAFQSMIERIRSGEFSHLIVWKIDRISRNLLDFTTMYSELKSLGVTFVSKNEQFDTSSAIGEAMLKIILVFAELERNMTAERVTAVMLSRANNAQWNGGRVPYGYDYNGEEFFINEEEAEHYCRITDAYYNGESLISITKSLNGSGCRTRQGNEWSPTTVHKLLTNDFYTGKYIYNKRDEQKGIIKPESEWIIIQDHHIPLIAQEKFDVIQKMLVKNRRGALKSGDTYIKKNIHLFGGLCECGICGSNMGATPDRMRASGYRPSLYGCQTRRKKASACSNLYTSDISLGPFIMTVISNMIYAQSNVSKSTNLGTVNRWITRSLPNTQIDKESLVSILERLKENTQKDEYKPFDVFSKSSDVTPELESLNNKIRRNDIALKRLQSVYLYSDQSIPEKDFIIERKRLLDELEELKKKAAELNPTSEDFMLDTDDKKATYFILAQYVKDPSSIDFEKFAKAANPLVLRNFLHDTIKRIIVINHKVTTIIFKNELTIRFTE